MVSRLASISPRSIQALRSKTVVTADVFMCFHRVDKAARLLYREIELPIAFQYVDRLSLCINWMEYLFKHWRMNLYFYIGWCIPFFSDLLWNPCTASDIWNCLYKQSESLDMGNIFSNHLYWMKGNYSILGRILFWRSWHF